MLSDTSRQAPFQRIVDWSLVFGIVGMLYVGVLVGKTVYDLIVLPAFIWSLIYAWFGFHFNMMIVLLALLVGLSIFVFAMAASFSRKLGHFLERRENSLQLPLRRLRAMFMGICLFATTLIFGLLYLVGYFYFSPPEMLF